jgi:hypothetical protein
MDFYRMRYLTYRREDRSIVDWIIGNHNRRGNIDAVWALYPATEKGFETMKLTCYLEEDFIAIRNELKNHGVVLR